MKIAQVAPLVESVPPALYGGTERVVYNLTEALVSMGHEVTLFASGDSKTSGRLVSITEKALRLDGGVEFEKIFYSSLLEEVLRRENEFDIIHFHLPFFHLPYTKHFRTPTISTVHDSPKNPGVQNLLEKSPDAPLIGLSRSHINGLASANWEATVGNGIPDDLFQEGSGDGGYFAFLGRFSKAKGVHRAIKIALATNTKLKIAAKIDPFEMDYYNKEVKPYLEHPLIDHVGEINEEQKNSFLGSAKALLMPISWSEPFGMVMIEALACGTPVVAWNMGSVSEIIDNRVTGIVVEDTNEAIDRIKEIDNISRARCRKTFEERFSAHTMALSYLKVFHKLIQEHQGRQFSRRIEITTVENRWPSRVEKLRTGNRRISQKAL